MCNWVVFTFHILYIFAALQHHSIASYVENERSNIYVLSCRVTYITLYKWKVYCSLVPEKYSGHETRLLKGAGHENRWCIGFCCQVVKDVWLSFILQ